LALKTGPLVENHAVDVENKSVGAEKPTVSARLEKNGNASNANGVGCWHSTPTALHVKGQGNALVKAG
jgi:hypothetical protein